MWQRKYSLQSAWWKRKALLDIRTRNRKLFIFLESTETNHSQQHTNLIYDIENDIKSENWNCSDINKNTFLKYKYDFQWNDTQTETLRQKYYMILFHFHIHCRVYVNISWIISVSYYYGLASCSKSRIYTAGLIVTLVFIAYIFSTIVWRGHRFY